LPLPPPPPPRCPLHASQEAPQLASPDSRQDCRIVQELWNEGRRSERGRAATLHCMLQQGSRSGITPSTGLGCFLAFSDGRANVDRALIGGTCKISTTPAPNMQRHERDRPHKSQRPAGFPLSRETRRLHRTLGWAQGPTEPLIHSAFSVRHVSSHLPSSVREPSGTYTVHRPSSRGLMPLARVLLAPSPAGQDHGA
jgi:hypothetical protein